MSCIKSIQRGFFDVKPLIGRRTIAIYPVDLSKTFVVVDIARYFQSDTTTSGSYYDVSAGLLSITETSIDIGYHTSEGVFSTVCWQVIEFA